MYFPILQVAPMAGNELAMGFDLGSEPRRREAMEAAARSGLTTTSEPITLIQETGKQKGMLIYRPVFASEEPQRLLGFALAVLRMDNLLLSATRDHATSLGIALLHKDAAPEILATSQDASSLLRSGISAMRPVLCGGQVFTVTASAGPEFIRLHPLHDAWWVALIGLSITAALAAETFRQEQRFDALTNLYFNTAWSYSQTGDRLSACNYYEQTLASHTDQVRNMSNSKGKPDQQVPRLVAQKKQENGCL
jgi:CHASE1-domain containing sensor protein